MLSLIQHSLEGLLAAGGLTTLVILLYGIKNEGKVNITVNGKERSLTNPVDYPTLLYVLLLGGPFILVQMGYNALNTEPVAE